ncbi:hypothetical protein BKA93DRAFT_736241 [Sparassis latifolia]
MSPLRLLRCSTSSSISTSYLLRSPPSSAPREVPTPLVFVSASRWDAASSSGMTEFASMLAERGFTCLEVDLAPPKDRQSNADTLMHYFETGECLSSHIRLCAIPFPPVIFARSFGSLIAQTYISSYPASGLLLISPPVSNEAVPSALLPSSLREFDFEPKFPCGILYAQGEMKRLEHNRLWGDPNVDRLMVKDTGAIDGREGQAKIEQWLDEIGV